MNEIGNTIASTENYKAKYDVVMKELLANKQFLARILKRFVPEFAEHSLEDIENKYIEAESMSVSGVGVARNRTNIDGLSNEDSSLNEGTIFYDILFRVSYPGRDHTSIGMYINLEAQNAYYNGYPLEMRANFYVARRLGAQLKSINRETNYGCLQKVYSIWLCMGDVPDFEANTATLYRTEKYDMIGSVKRIPEEYDLMNIVILRINDKKKPEDEVLGMLQVLCSNLLNKEEKLSGLKDYGIHINDHIKEGVKSMCNLSDLVEARAAERGGEIAKAKKVKEIALEMLKDNISYEQIMKYTKVSEALLKEWEQEISCIH